MDLKSYKKNDIYEKILKKIKQTICLPIWVIT